MAQIPFIPNAYGHGRSKAFETQRFINLFPEISSGPNGKSIAALVGTPGLRLWHQGTSGPVRASMGFNGLCYVVKSNKLISITADGLSELEIGTLQTSTGRVSMKNNGLASTGIGGNQICIVDGVAGYIYNVSTGIFSTISGGGFPTTPLQVEYIDSYFVVTDGSMSSWTSNIFDGTIWNALTKNPVQAAPDTIQKPVNLHQQLFFIKQYTTEVYYNTGTSTSLGSPFSRVPGAVIDYGTNAPWSVARGNNSIFFLATQRQDEAGEFVGVVELNGYVPTLITPPSIVFRMSQSSDLTQCFGYFYYAEGHNFYVLTNPIDNWTFVYDASTQMWHERSTTDSFSSDINRHLGNSYVFFNNMHLVGDLYTSNIYEMSSQFYTDAGEPIISEQTTQHLYDKNDLDNIFIGQLQIDIEAGVGSDNVNSPATAIASINSSGQVDSCTIIYNGADYTEVPIVILRSVDGAGTGATATAIVSSGSIVSVTITNGGAGYTRAPEVIFAISEIIPSAGLSISRDGGRTWGNEHIRSMGKVGEYRKRLLWRSVGHARDKVFKLKISSPVKKMILGYYVSPA